MAEETAPSGPTLTLDATLQNMPTAAADALLGLDGLLIAAIGPDLTNATITAKEFSRDAGWTQVDLQTTHSRLTGRVKGIGAALRTTANDPPHATLELSPALRERLLKRIHPLLADIRTIEQPITMDVTKPFVLPLDGDLTKLRGVLELTIGAVEFDSGSLSLAALRAFKTGQAVVPGSIGPVVINVQSGVVTYEQFVVQIDEYRFQYSGTTNLVTDEINLTTRLPIEALDSTFHELEDIARYAEGIDVLMVLKGSPDNPKLEFTAQLNPDVIQKELGDEIEKAIGEEAGKVIDDILKGFGGLGGRR
jgi:hypothetical protein